MKHLFICISLFIPAHLFAKTYDVSMMAEQGLIEVNACFDEPPEYLTVHNRRALDYFKSLNGLTRSRWSNSNRLYLKSDNGCVSYQFDLNAARATRQSYKIDDGWLVNNTSWLATPPSQKKASMTIELASKQHAISGPWTKIGNDHVVGATPLDWRSRMAFGNIQIEQVGVGQSTLNIAYMGVSDEQKRQQLNGWLHQAASAVSGLYGEFPLAEVQVLVVDIGKQREPIPWAEVQRGESPAVHFFIDASRSVNQFKQDWTAVHEFSHLMLPRIDYRDRWLTEGLASYYQNVARSRHGMISQSEAWKKLNAGFDRGRRAGSDSLLSSRKRMHVYWGGAAYFLLADIRLRELGKDEGLIGVLADLKSCCLPDNRIWPARDFVSKLDQLSKTDVFSELYENEARRQRFMIDNRLAYQISPNLKSVTRKIFSPLDD